MSSGRRRSSPRPSHADISGNGGARQMLLDNHDIDDDNNEGVDVTEGVEASNVMRGSNIPNPLPELADRPMINISADDSIGANGSAEINGPAEVNSSAGANGSAGANESVGSEASTSTGVGESNEVGESSGGQSVELKWVNDKSRDHMEKYQERMVESHGGEC
ncbi:hypothetical protein Tco_0154486 [Tanacetum coccineum]